MKDGSFLGHLIFLQSFTCLCVRGHPRQAENQALCFPALKAPVYVGDSCMSGLFTVQTAGDGAALPVPLSANTWANI